MPISIFVNFKAFFKGKENKLSLFTLLFAAIVLSACQQPTTEKAEGSIPQGLLDQPYLDKVQQKHDSASIDQQLLTARLLLQRGEPVSASTLLSQLPTPLSAAQQQERQLIEAEIYQMQQQPVTALLTLNSIQPRQLSVEQRNRYYTLKEQLDNTISPWQIVRQLISQTATLQGSERQNNLDQIWHYLITLPESSIAATEVSLSENVLQGWLDLLHDYHSQHSTPKQWQMMLDMWRISHPNHPASAQLPSQLLGSPGVDPQQAPLSGQPLHIALFLPLSDQAKIYGQAIKQGFLAAAKLNNIQNSNSQIENIKSDSTEDGNPVSGNSSTINQTALDSEQPTPSAHSFATYTTANGGSVKVYDVSQRPIAELLQEAERDGATLVVGPLLKHSVEEIAQMDTPLKILALNEPKRVLRRDNICYFALAPEDEARSAADHIWSEGKRQPLVVIPAGALGERVSNAFAQSWQQHSSMPALVQVFPSIDEMRSRIQQRAGLPLTGKELIPTQISSQQITLPGRGHNTIIKAPLEETAIDYTMQTSTAQYHSTQEVSDSNLSKQNLPEQIDAIYVVATQGEMALLKPLMDMNSSQLQPRIYMSSRSYQSLGSTSYRLELEGMEYSEIPLLSGVYPEILPAVSQRFNNDYTLVRLYAMGMDAWMLAHRFEQMQLGSSFHLNGYTGDIQSNPQCILNRKLSWLRFQQSQPQPVP